MENENPKIELGAEKKFEYGNIEIELDVKNRAVTRYIQKSFHDLTMLIGTCNIPIKLSMELLFDREGSEKYI
tara:strand:+ start:88 stop:303 length:216 start_codon:yes stop_codon:yes gene_type:complete